MSEKNYYDSSDFLFMFFIGIIFCILGFAMGYTLSPSHPKISSGELFCETHDMNYSEGFMKSCYRIDNDSVLHERYVGVVNGDFYFISK